MCLVESSLYLTSSTSALGAYVLIWILQVWTLRIGWRCWSGLAVGVLAKWKYEKDEQNSTIAKMQGNLKFLLVCYGFRILKCLIIYLLKILKTYPCIVFKKNAVFVFCLILVCVSVPVLHSVLVHVCVGVWLAIIEVPFFYGLMFTRW
jgi:hypothetical protein